MTNRNVQSPKSTSIHITREIAMRVLNTIDAGLVPGTGVPTPGSMCIEAAVCYALDLPHDDDPGCVAESLRRLNTRLNDAPWSSPQARARGLRRLGVAQLGSLGVLNEKEFARRVIRLAITKQVPWALRSAASIHDDPAHHAALNAAASECERAADRQSCLSARGAAYGAFDAADEGAAARLVAKHAANAAILAGEAAVCDRACEAASSAWSSAEARVLAAKAQGDSTKSAEVFDSALSEFAEDVVQILVGLRAPGCEWLDLTEAA